MKSRPGPVPVMAVVLPVLFAAAARAATNRITLLHVSDLHGHVADWHFLEERRAPLGLVRVAAIVRRERERDPDLVLLDGGDTIQGSPLAYLHSRPPSRQPHVMAVVMNALGFDAMVVGNHEYNYGQQTLDRFIEDCAFPVLSGNVTDLEGRPRYRPYVLLERRGVKLGLLGLTTPGVPGWELPRHIEGLRFGSAVDAARRWIPEMKAAGATVLVAMAHAGLHAYPPRNDAGAGWTSEPGAWPGADNARAARRDFVLSLAARCPELDVILAGHAHRHIPGAYVYGVLVVMPGSWGRAVARVKLDLDAGGRVVDKFSRLLYAAEVEPDPEIARLAGPYQQEALAHFEKPIGRADGPFPGGLEARRADGPLADFINAVQTNMAARGGCPAQISAAAVFNRTGHLPEGELAVKHVYGIYQYDNTLTVLEVTGAALRAAMERAAACWAPWDGKGPPQPAEGSRGYHYDMFTGVEYAFDLSRPAGSRVARLARGGRPVRPEERLRLAVNNHRAAGGGGYDMYEGARVLYESKVPIREAIEQYIRESEALSPATFFRRNWELVAGPGVSGQ